MIYWLIDKIWFLLIAILHSTRNFQKINIFNILGTGLLIFTCFYLHVLFLIDY